MKTEAERLRKKEIENQHEQAKNKDRRENLQAIGPRDTWSRRSETIRYEAGQNPDDQPPTQLVRGLPTNTISSPISMGKLDPRFDRDRNKEGTTIYRFETELAWFEALSRLHASSGELLSPERSQLADSIAKLSSQIRASGSQIDRTACRRHPSNNSLPEYLPPRWNTQLHSGR